MNATLIAILLVFVALMAAVLYLCLRGRKRAMAGEGTPPGARRDADEDNRIAVVIFGAILMGAVLAILAGLVLFAVTA
ncbi:MAG: hypothetical protein JNK75_07335 [Betaproteobacteria bacterium]|nr:hypothetical protein [Betaproteobacteria bacterium]